MTKYTLTIFAILWSLQSIAGTSDSLLIDLQSTLKGTFSNFEQHQENPDRIPYLKRHAVPIWTEKHQEGVYWMFVETETISQDGVTESKKILERYQRNRQDRIERSMFEARDKEISTMLTGAWRIPDRLEKVDISDFDTIHCPSYFHPDTLGRFIGVFGLCEDPKGEANKKTFHIEASQNTVHIEEIAYDNAGEIIWRIPMMFKRELDEYETLREQADSITNEKHLSRLVGLLSGDFSNEVQHAQQPNQTPLLHFHYRRIWENRSNGLWIYGENESSKDKGENWEVTDQVFVRYYIEEGSIKSEQYTFSEGSGYIGAWKTPEKLDNVALEDLRKVDDCPLEFRPAAKRSYVGVMANCADATKTADFTTTEIALSKGGMRFMHRGFDERGEMIWESIIDLQRQ